jgi:hypothetical protein
MWFSDRTSEQLGQSSHTLRQSPNNSGLLAQVGQKRFTAIKRTKSYIGFVDQIVKAIVADYGRRAAFVEASAFSRVWNPPTRTILLPVCSKFGQYAGGNCAVKVILL